jgi:long-chain acyl-CoA synthetase
MDTFAELLQQIEERYSSNSAPFHARTEKGWVSLSTTEFVRTVKTLVLALFQLGVKKGTCVGILAQPSPYWTIADLAIILSGGISVPLFANISNENFAYETKETQVKILFVDGQDQMHLFEKHQAQFDLAIFLDNRPPAHPKCIGLQELLRKGETLQSKEPKLLAQLFSTLHADDVASIIYTSGSTGIPKGVELTQTNLLCLAHFDGFHWDAATDRYLSILPLAHVFGHCINLWMLFWGISIYYFNDYKQLATACQEVKPTIVVAVPRILEKIHAKMTDQLHSSHGIKRWIGERAFGLALKEKHGFIAKRLIPLADRLVYAKLRKALGGAIRVVISGGAALSIRLQHFYKNIGIPIYEGWGLTEACPVTVNYPGKHKIGTVGPIVLNQQKIDISPEGEVLVSGPLVMKGYYKLPQLTDQTIDPDGRLHTGDRGKMDTEGFLTIFGRMKELYKTSTGEYVAPVPIEQALTHYPLIDMAMAIAEGRKYASCLLFPNLDVLHRMKKKQKAEQMSDAAFLESLYIKGEMDKLLQEINQHLNHWEQVHKYKFILDPLTIEGGELTASMKIRRDIVANKYKDLIEEMYAAIEET